MVPVAFVVACSSSPQRQTLARLHDVPPDLAEIEVEDSLVLAMHSYRSFLEETPESEMTPEAMRRLADLQIENEFGIMGTGDIVELSAPPDSVPEASSFAVQPAEPLNLSGVGDLSESDEDFEARATGEYEIAFDDVSRDLPLPDGTQPVATSGATEEPDSGNQKPPPVGPVCAISDDANERRLMRARLPMRVFVF